LSKTKEEGVRDGKVSSPLPNYYDNEMY